MGACIETKTTTRGKCKIEKQRPHTCAVASTFTLPLQVACFLQGIVCARAETSTDQEKEEVTIACA